MGQSDGLGTGKIERVDRDGERSQRGHKVEEREHENQVRIRHHSAL